jgi:hypothetical protein
MKKIISILIPIFFLLGCSNNLHVNDIFVYAHANDTLVQDYYYFFSDNKDNLENISNNFLKSTDKKSFISKFYSENKFANTYLSRQSIRYVKNSNNYFSIIRDGINGFNHSIKIEGDSVLLIPDSSDCPKLRPCIYKVNNIWKQGEQKGIFCFERYETINIQNRKFNKCIVIRMDTEKGGFVRFWIKPELGIIKTYSETPPIFTIQYLSKYIMTNDEYTEIENP